MEQAAKARRPFAVALIDGQMPDVGGFTLAQKIRNEPRLAATRLIMLTSTGSRDARHDENLAAILTKPVKHSTLLAAITAAVSGDRDSAAKESQSEPAKAPAQPLRILLAEDDLVNQKLAVRLLEKQGHTVTVAASGREALALLDSPGQAPANRFDLALLDVQMPDMDGLQAAAEIRRREKTAGGHLPLIALTAYAMQGDRERCLAAGMDGYVAKPIRPSDLMQAIAEVTPAELAPPLVDQRALLERLNGDRQLLNELIALFQADCPRMLDAVHQAAEAGDAVALKAAAHKLKGSAANFCAITVVKAALRLENMGRQRDLSGSGAAVVVLDREVARLLDALKNLERGQR
jgi:CheY-like chemotaxis protein/HPt (histidine-containing phosphotransfer) domain-containing protein